LVAEEMMLSQIMGKYQIVTIKAERKSGIDVMTKRELGKLMRRERERESLEGSVGFTYRARRASEVVNRVARGI
jgi:hypothetical protein